MRATAAAKQVSKAKTGCTACTAGRACREPETGAGWTKAALWEQLDHIVGAARRCSRTHREELSGSQEGWALPVEIFE